MVFIPLRLPTAPNYPVPAEVLHIFSLYKSTGDTRYRNEIVTLYLHMIKVLAGEIAATCRVAADDLLQEGLCGHDGKSGFIGALDHYDPAKGQLATYCYKAAKNAMLHHVKHFGDTVRVPTRGHKAWFKYRRQAESIAREWEGMTVPVDVVLGDSFPCEQRAVLTILTRKYLDPGVMDVADEAGLSLRHDERLAIAAFKNLEPLQRSLALAFYGPDKEFRALCRKEGYSPEQGENIAVKALNRIKAAIGFDQSAVPVVAMPSRILPKVAQLTLLVVKPGKVKAVRVAPVRKTAGEAGARQLALI